jgi:hypothetical protein
MLLVYWNLFSETQTFRKSRWVSSLRIDNRIKLTKCSYSPLSVVNNSPLGLTSNDFQTA